jgi:hypothetical protein
MQHFLKPAAGAAGAEVIASELLQQLLLAAADRTVAALHASFAQGTPGDASTCAQKEERAFRFFFVAIQTSY